jgi:hypothetical protein
MLSVNRVWEGGCKGRGRDRIETRGRRIERVGNGCGGCTSAADVSEIHVEIFDLDRPVAVDRGFGAGTGSPAGASRIPAQGDRRRVSAQVAVGQTARRIEQHPLGRQEADPTPRGTEPVEPVIRGEQRRAQRTSGNGADIGAGSLVAALDIGFHAEQPRSTLPVVAGLAAADEAIDVRAPNQRQCAENGID